MKLIENYENIQASTGDFDRLPAGGYVCRITLADDYDDKSYLKIEYDIASGEYKNYYEKQFERFPSYWGGTIYRSYKEKALGMFKHFINCIENANHGYVWNWDEKSLVGKYIGLVIGEEEYINGKGELRTRLYVKDVKTVDDIKTGNFKVPEFKKLKGVAPSQTPSANADFEEIADNDDLPF